YALYELFADHGGRFFGRASALQPRCFSARNEVSSGRDVWKSLRTGCGVHRQRTQLARSDELHRLGYGVEHYLYLSGHEIGHRGRATAIRHMDHVDPGHHFEQFAGDMDRRADATRSVADLAGIGLHIADELGNGL